MYSFPTTLLFADGVECDGEECSKTGSVRPCDIDPEILLAGCNPDCANGGTCKNGTCICPLGITGRACNEGTCYVVLFSLRRLSRSSRRDEKYHCNHNTLHCMNVHVV